MMATSRGHRRVGVPVAVRALLACGFCAGPAAAQTQLAISDLRRFSIEELATVEITSASKRAQPLSDAAASIHVLTNADVQSSGATSLPEALRLAPNLHVARIDALDYAISARGLNGFESANKLQVLIDGRSVYSPLYSGVEWDAQHVMLEDLERIEIVSGPGGTLWGANAVNGVVSVTTRDARETTGWLLSAASGSVDSLASVRYGRPLGVNSAFRVYGTAIDRGSMLQASGASANGGWRGWQAGFRSDFGLGANTFTLQGDVHDKDIASSLGLAGLVKGGNLLARYEHVFGDGAILSVQTYFSRAERKARGIYDRTDSLDGQLQFNSRPGTRHQIVAGVGHRTIDDEFQNFVNAFTLDPPTRRVRLANAFVQDEISLRSDLRLILGLKLEHSSFTGLEYMPNLRLAWQAGERTLLWGAVSRAVRTPSRLERELVIPGIIVPGRFEPETLIAYELGYRGQPLPNTSVSVTGFLHDYDHLRTNELSPGGRPPLFVGNEMRGRTLGIEAWADLDVTPTWRLSASFTALRKDFELKPGNRDVSRLEAAGVDPDFQASLRSQMQLSERLDLDLRLRYVDEVPRSTAAGYVGAPEYFEADARLAWRINDDVELAVGGSNLLDDSHAEASEARRKLIRRSVYAGLKWKY
jgi:iron complex outermembrane receptor protein